MNSQYDIIVIGAGPVGLFLGNLAGQRGLKTLVLEKRQSKPQTSRAIGIMPPSLELLETVGAAGPIVESGVRVTRAVVHGRKRELGAVDFQGLPGAYPYLLSTPAFQTEEILEQTLLKEAAAELRKGAEVVQVLPREDGVEVQWRVDESGEEHRAAARFAIACDGASSVTRATLPLGRASKMFPQTFLMGDFTDRSGFGTDAHLFFTPLGAVESFPLPEGRRRWVVQTGHLMTDPEPEFIEKTVAKRSGHQLDPADRHWLSPFGIERHLSERYFDGRVVLCGDAAHVMPPIGGQGMNTGFADAWLLAETLQTVIQGGADHEAAFQEYTRRRRIAAQAAMGRAAMSMQVGTITGTVGSALRNAVIYAALHSPLRTRLSPRFAMRTIPYGTLDQLSLVS